MENFPFILCVCGQIKLSFLADGSEIVEYWSFGGSAIHYIKKINYVNGK